MEKNADGTYDSIYFMRAEKSTITVTCDMGATLTCVSNTGLTNEIFELTEDKGGSHDFIVYETGVKYAVTASSGTSETSEILNVVSIGVYSVELTLISKVLNEASWASISMVSFKGANYWSIGDAKQIIIDGKLSDGLVLSNYLT